MKKLLKDKTFRKLDPPKSLLDKIKRSANYKRKHTKSDKDKEKGKNKKALRNERSNY